MNPKNTFDDIIPPASASNAIANSANTAPNENAKRSIRNIPIREKKPNKIDELLEETADMRSEHHVPPPAYVPPPSFQSEKKSGKGIWVVLLVIVLLAGGTFGALMFFGGATVDVTLKTESIPVDFTIASTADSDASGTLPYKVVPVQKEGTKEVAATGAATKVEKKATGTIIVYNNYSSASQQLIATTRFETPEGLIYRLDRGITVPGNGSVEAAVTADQPGEKYNADKKDFTIVGFKGSPKYDKFYARSKTALAGGFVGTMPKIADADLKTANEELQQSLMAEAMSEIKATKSADSVFLKDGLRSSFTSSISPATEGKAVVTGKLIAEGLVFERKELEKAITTTKNGQYYRFDNLEDLVLSIQNQKPVDSFISSPVLSLKLAGTLTTGESFDPNALKDALAGKSKVQLQEILKMWPEITQAEATLRPFWSASFPENTEKITINVTK